jgi:hypothetical protein
MIAISDTINSNDNSCQKLRIIQWLGNERAGEFYILE